MVDAWLLRTHLGPRVMSVCRALPCTSRMMDDSVWGVMGVVW
jgi:hypothetical protein